MRMKKLLSALLALALLLTLLPTSALAAELPDPEREATSGRIVTAAPQPESEFSLWGFRQPTDYFENYSAGEEYIAGQLTDGAKTIYDAIKSLLFDENGIRNDIIFTSSDLMSEQSDGTTGTRYYLAVSDNQSRDFTKAIKTCYESGSTDFNDALVALDRDHSELFWRSSASFAYDTDKQSYYLKLYISPSWCPDGGRDLQEDIDTLNEGIDRLVEDAQEETTFAEQLKVVHDWLVNYNKYGEAGNQSWSYQWEAVSAFDNSLSPVCEGYARAFKLVCDRLGVPCVLVSGFTQNDANGKESGAHMWNYVRLGGNWYLVDVTWDDPVMSDGSDVLRDDYFLVGSVTQQKHDGSTKYHHSSWGVMIGADGNTSNAQFYYPPLSEFDYKDAPKPVTVSSIQVAPGAEETNEVELPVPGADPNTLAFTATVKDEDGNELTGQDVTWGLAAVEESGEVPAGVSINENGLVTVTSEAADAVTAEGLTLTVTAASKTAPSITGSSTFTIKRAASAAAKIVFTVDGHTYDDGDAITVAVPSTTEVIPVVRDQYGAVMTDAVDIRMTAADGVTLSDNTITVTEETADNTSVTLTAACGGITANLTVTAVARKMEADWNAVSVRSGVYGDKNSKLVTLPSVGTANITDASGTSSVNGTFTIEEPDAIQIPGEKKIAVTFTADNGTDTDTREFTVTISKRTVTVEADKMTIVYGQPIPTEFTFSIAPNSLGLVDGDTKEDLKVRLQCPNAENKAGTYEITAAGGSESEKYKVEVISGQLVIEKATITPPSEINVAPFPEIWASDSRNASLQALEEAVNEGRVSLSGNDKLKLSWRLKGETTWTNMGGTYTFVADLVLMDPDNYTIPDGAGANVAELTVDVKPVTATLSMAETSKSVRANSVTDGATYASLGLPTEVAVTYDDGTTPADTWPITQWSMTAAEIIAKAKSVTGGGILRLSLTPVFGPENQKPVWAALEGTPQFTLILTGLDPATVELAAPAAAYTYNGQPITPPAFTAKDKDGKTIEGAEFGYSYTGTSDPNAAPVNAGTYTVTAHLISGEYSGVSAPVEITIGKAEQTLTVGKTLTLLPQALKRTITASVTPEVAGDSTGQVTFSLKEGEGTAVSVNPSTGEVTGLSNGTAAVTVTAAETDNYNKASEDVSVTVIKDPVLSISKVSDAENGDASGTLSATLDGSRVVVAGLGNADNVKVTLKLYDGSEKTLTKDGLVVSLDDGTEVAVYELDTSKVKPRNERIEIKEELKAAEVSEDLDQAVKDALKQKDSIKIEGLVESATTALQELAEKALESFATEPDEKIKATVTVSIEIEVKDYKDDSNNKLLELDITPKYVISIKDEDGTIKETHEAKELDDLKAPVTLTVKLPDGFVKEGDKLFVEHSHGASEVEIIPALYDEDDNTVTWQQSTFSTDRIVVNNRTVTITFVDADGNKLGEITYNWGDVNKTELLSLKDGEYWTYKDADGKDVKVTDLKLTEELFNKGTVTLTLTKDKPEDDPGTPGTTDPGPTNPGTKPGTTPGISTYPDYDYFLSDPIGATTGTRYSVNTSSIQNGTVSLNTASAKPGDTVTVTPRPNTGYELVSLTVTNKNGNPLSLTNRGDGTYAFTMPSGAVTVSAAFEPVVSTLPVSLPFADVSTASWYYDAVRYVYGRNLMTGTDWNRFSPDGTTSRAMLVTILYRLEGQPAVGFSGFRDVAAGQWYTDAIAWASANGIVTGYDNSRFGPGDVVTREQAAAILYRYCAYKGYNVSAYGNLGAYADAGQVSAYAVTPMSWANAVGLIQGVGSSRLSPGVGTTRAEMATILMRFCENVAK